MKSILVYGDVMVDKSWIVTEHLEKSVQSHGNVKPMRRIHPEYSDETLGGAGTLAVAIARLCPTEARVHLLCCSGPIGEEARSELSIHQLPVFGTPITTVKFRIYRQADIGKPELIHRFDQDAPVPNVAGELPELPQPDFVVVSDFNKGVVQAGIISTLLSRYPSATWLIDSKNCQIFEMARNLRKRGGTVFANREEAMRLWQSEVNDSEGTLDISRDFASCRNDVLKLGKSLMSVLRCWNIVVKLDRDGACLFSDLGSTRCCVAPIDAPGISAGDIFLAGWIQAVLDDCDPQVALVHATEIARDWVKFSSSFDAWKTAWDRNCETPSPRDFSPVHNLRSTALAELQSL